MAVDVVCLGILVADVVVRPFRGMPSAGSLDTVEEIAFRAGGCALNTASILARFGLRTAVVGKVGKDQFGEFLLSVLDERGIDHANVTRGDTPTSTTVVLVDDDGERTFLHNPGANATLNDSEIDLTQILSAKALHIGGALVMASLDGPPMAQILGEAKAMGLHTSLDVVFDPTDKWDRARSCLPKLDLFCPSLAEARAIAGEQDPSRAAAWIHARGTPEVVITMGAKGCLVSNPERQEFLDGVAVNAIDGTGAGDAFTAGLLYGKLAGWPLQRSARLATAVGALATTEVGATEGVRGLDEALSMSGLTAEA